MGQGQGSGDHVAMQEIGHRLVFEELPRAVRRDLEAALGSGVVEAVNRRGGFSPSLAARCQLVDGRVVFVKGVSPAQNPESPDILRREARVSAALPATAPAPRLLHVLDDGNWILTVYEYVEGNLPGAPWSPAELDLVLGATWALATVDPPRSLPTVTERYGPVLTGWRSLAADSGLDGVLDDWSARHLDRLADHEPAWEEAVSGEELVHGDVRSDNVLLDGDRVTFVDWSAACAGRTFFDVVSMLPSVALEGGGDPEEVLAGHGGQGVEPDAVTAVVLADAGYFLDRARLPDPPGLPTVRAFQRAQGQVCVAWLRQRLGWQ